MILIAPLTLSAKIEPLEIEERKAEVEIRLFEMKSLSNSYYNEGAAKLLAGFVDVYLLDFKYGPFDCAKRIPDALNYWDVCARNHIYGNKYGELIIRVLVLPNHLECCTKHILKWIANNLGRNARTNAMFQHRPEWRAYEAPELSRRLTIKEMKRAIELAGEAGLTNFVT